MSRRSVLEARKVRQFMAAHPGANRDDYDRRPFQRKSAPKHYKRTTVPCAELLPQGRRVEW